MKNNNSIDSLKKKKIDAVYGKKKHFNASERHDKHFTRLNWLTIILSTLTSVSLLPQFKEILQIQFGETTSNQISFLLSLILTIVLSLQKFYNFDELSQKNAKVANLYLRIYKDIGDYLSLLEDNRVEEKLLPRKLKEFQDRLDDANILAIGTKVNRHDYKNAKKGIDSGEESYTEGEHNNC